MPPISAARRADLKQLGLLTIGEAAAMAKVTATTIRSWLDRGRIRGAAVGPSTFVQRASLEAAIKPQEIDNSGGELLGAAPKAKDGGAR